MTYRVMRKQSWNNVWVPVPQIKISQVTQDRVRGIYTGGNELITDFDVKLYPGQKFNLGSGSNKIRYQLEKVESAKG